MIQYMVDTNISGNVNDIKGSSIFYLICPLMSNKALRSQFYIEIVPSDDYGCISFSC